MNEHWWWRMYVSIRSLKHKHLSAWERDRLKLFCMRRVADAKNRGAI